MKLTNHLLNETIKAQVKKYLNEAIGEGFSFEKLKEIPSFRGRLKYCMNNLGFKIGTGSSRACFQLDDNRILKLALNAKGIAQNNVESRLDYNLDSLGIRPEIYDETDFENNLFIVCEYVLPAKKADFKQELGITWGEYLRFLYTCNAEKKGGYHDMDWDTLYEMIENNDKLWSIHDYIANYNVVIGDLARISNYGLSKSNGIVILDTGLDDYVWNNYYKRY